MHIDDRIQMPLIFPVGYQNSWNAIYCCGEAMIKGIDDLKYIDNVISSVGPFKNDFSNNGNSFVRGT
eukprot:UN01166